MNPKQIIEKIRTKLQEGNRDPSNLNNALLALSEEIYKLENHYIFELIQNADDNQYPNNAIPSIEFKIDGTKLVLTNNEVGFNEENINSICSIGKSTKKINKIQGYIGEKGLGFKSIFKITNTPEIYSNSYQFSFKALPEDGIDDGVIGYILPYWIDNPDKNYLNSKTNIVLPAKKGSCFSMENFSEIKPELLLFLRKLKHITLEDKQNKNYLTISRKDDKDLITIRTKEKKEGNIEENLEFYKISKFNIDMSNLEIEKRKGFKETTIIFAFPITEQGQAKFDKTRKAFAFLPVHDYGLPFIIQSDFLLTTSREDILENNPWNEQIIKNIPEGFIRSSMPLFKQDQLLSKTFYGYLDPARVDSLFEPTIKDVIRKLYDEDCILCEGNHWRKPTDALLSEKLLEPIIVNEELNRLIGKEFVSKDIIKFKAVLEKLGCEPFSIDDLLECLKNKEWVEKHKRNKNWFKDLFTYLFSKIINEEDWSRALDLREKIKALDIFLLKNGEISSSNNIENKIFMPLSDNINYAFESNLSILDEKIIPNKLDKSRVYEFFYELGISKADPEDIIENYILLEHRKYHTSDAEVDSDILISHARYIKDNVNAIDAGLQEKLENSMLLLLRRDENFDLLRNTYLGDDYNNPNLLEKNFINSLSLPYISMSYVKDPTSNNDVSEWFNFFKLIKAGIALKINSVNKSSYRELIDYEASEQLKIVLKSTDIDLKKSLIKLLANNWVDYYQDFIQQKNRRNYSTFFSNLGGMQVPIKNNPWGQLKDSYIENDDTRQLGEDLPFLDVELVLHKHKPFLDALGVRHSITLDVALNRLEELASKSNVPTSQISKLYKFIEMRSLTEETKNYVNSRFRLSALIYSGTKWLSTSEVCWKAYSNKIIASSYPSLENLYPESKTFFLNTVNVQESLSSSQLISILNDLPNSNEEDKFKTSAARVIYNHLEDELSETDSRPDWIDEFNKKPLLWTNKSKLQQTRENIFINDTPHIATLFNDCVNISFLDIEYDHIPRYENLIDLIQIPFLSKAIHKILEPTATKKILDEPTYKIKKYSNLIERYFYTHYQTTFKKLIKGDVFSKALTATIYSVDRLLLKITLSDICVSSYFDSAEIDGDFYIDITISNKKNRLNIEIAKQLADRLGEPGAKEFIEFILIDNEESLEYRTKDLKSIPEEYRDQLAKVTNIINSDIEIESSNIVPLDFSQQSALSEKTLVFENNNHEISLTEQVQPKQPIDFSVPQEKELQDQSRAPSFQGLRSSMSEGASEIDEQPTPPKGRSSRGFSYVNHTPPNNHSDGAEKQTKKLEIDKAAIDAVIDAEKAEGFEVEVFSHYNEGFDIHSKKGNELRIIEVKGTGGPWDHYGVSLSPSQMFEAKKSKEDFWLYVVEHAISENPRIYKIQNPYEKITSFQFDRGWKEFDDSFSKEITQEPKEGMRIYFDTNEVGIIENVKKYGELYTLVIKAESQEDKIFKVWDPSKMKISES